MRYSVWSQQPAMHPGQTDRHAVVPAQAGTQCLAECAITMIDALQRVGSAAHRNAPGPDRL